MNNTNLLDLYRNMQRVRKFEEQCCESFELGDVQGFLHVSIGEEAVPSGVCANLRKTDFITSTHRGHGHVLSKGADSKIMMAELCGRVDGYNRGKGGSMHIANTELGVLGANGIVGAGQTLAVGSGLSAKIRKTNAVTVCFFGDGATNEGTFHESLNAASIWKLPIVFVCTNNLYGVSTRQDRSMNISNISDRAISYGIPGITADGNDVIEVYNVAKTAIDRARNGEGPTLLEFKSYKWHGHFEGDPGNYRPQEEVEAWKAKDPIKKMKKYLIENSIASEKELEEIEEAAIQEMKDAIEFAIDSDFPDEESVLRDTYTDIVEEGR